MVTRCAKMLKSSDSQVSSTASGDATLADAAPAAEEKKVMDISIALWDLTEFGNDDVGKKISDDLKVNITVVPMDWGNYVEQKQLWAASNNLPDVIGTYTVDDDITRFYGWQESGLTRTIPDEMINKYPTVKMLFENNDIQKMVKSIKNANFAIPRPNSLKNLYQFDQGVGFYYRKDWLANVGITKEPETIDELYDMLKKFTLNDPDQNQKNDTYGITTSKAPYMTFCWWGVNPESWIQEDGKWIPGYASPKILEALKFWNKIFKEKIIDPEFAINNLNQSIQKFSQGTFGVVARNVDDRWVYKMAMENFAKAQGMDKAGADKVLESIGILAPIKVDQSSTSMWPRIMDTSGTEISAKVDDEKLERIMELYEYLSTPEMLTTLRYGFEGKEYVKNGDAIVPVANPQTGLAYNIAAIYPSAAINELVSWDMDNATETPSIPQPIKDLAKKVRDQFNPIAGKDNLEIRFMSTPAKDATYVDVREEFTTLMMTNGDIEQAYNKWLQEQMDKGISSAIAELNAKAAELGIK